jgi:hypothetical protein
VKTEGMVSIESTLRAKELQLGLGLNSNCGSDGQKKMSHSRKNIESFIRFAPTSPSFRAGDVNAEGDAFQRCWL